MFHRIRGLEQVNGSAAGEIALVFVAGGGGRVLRKGSACLGLSEKIIFKSTGYDAQEGDQAWRKMVVRCDGESLRGYRTALAEKQEQWRGADVTST